MRSSSRSVYAQDRNRLRANDSAASEPMSATATATAAAAGPAVKPATTPATTASTPPPASTSAQRIRHRRGEGDIAPCSGDSGMTTRYRPPLPPTPPPAPRPALGSRLGPGLTWCGNHGNPLRGELIV